LCDATSPFGVSVSNLSYLLGLGVGWELHLLSAGV
jgi:hypothetical protein